MVAYEANKADKVCFRCSRARKGAGDVTYLIFVATLERWVSGRAAETVMD